MIIIVWGVYRDVKYVGEYDKGVHECGRVVDGGGVGGERKERDVFSVGGELAQCGAELHCQGV